MNLSLLLLASKLIVNGSWALYPAALNSARARAGSNVYGSPSSSGVHGHSRNPDSLESSGACVQSCPQSGAAKP